MALELGLREDKKRRTRQEILSNAIMLFRKQGLRAARTSEIARLSGISPGTLFNYFPTKDALVEAWLRGELDGVVNEMGATLGERGLRPMLRGVCRLLSAEYLEPRSLRAEGWRFLGRGRSARFQLQPDSPLALVVRAEQERDRVRRDLRPEALAELLMDGLEGGLVAALQWEPSSDASPTTAQDLEGRAELILDGMRKRNERVSAAALKRPASGTQA